MRTRIAMFFYVVLSVVLSLPSLAFSSVIYQEDFATDPGFQIRGLHPVDVIAWDPETQSYRTDLHETTWTVRFKVAYSPIFTRVENRSFVIQFDYKRTRSSWGVPMHMWYIDNQTGQPFPDDVNQAVFDPLASVILDLGANSSPGINVCDYYFDQHVSELCTYYTSYQMNTWYTYVLTYHSNSHTADLVILNRGTQEIFYSKYGASFYPTPFNQLVLGAAMGMGGDWSGGELYYDNIRISLVDEDKDNDGFTVETDCNDLDSSVFPGAPEVCDGKDNDCDGIVPVNEADLDNDTFLACADCNDIDAEIHPGALELPGNVTDENCDGDLGDCSPLLLWRNHGQYVRCVSHSTEALVDQGLLTQEEADALVSSAAQSEVGKK